MTLGDLVKQYRAEHKLTMDEFSQKCGLSKGYISMLEKNKNPQTKKPIAPALSTIKQIASAMDLDFNYVLSLLDKTQKVSLQNTSSYVKIPVLGYVAAGIPADAIENIVDWEEIPQAVADKGDYFGLVINGDSMEPRICKGDIVIVKKQSDVESGDIAIVIVDGDEGTCKKVIKNQAGINLVSLNPKYEPIFYTWEEVESLPVVINGKVIELRGKI